ncbi:MAG: fimbrillin family protein [Rikenellaceae bacterium]|jgi:hypothetical protein|nr:fimbrillin family protein [Rikenellaceae bacterium]
MSKTFIFGAMATLTAVFASCGKGGGSEDRSPMLLSSQIEGHTTRADGGVWAGGEQVQVALGSEGGRTFVASVDGTLTPATTIYWQDYSSRLIARAWHPAVGAYIFPVDQSDQAKFQSADFVFAPEVRNVTAGNSRLTFVHCLAKVTAALSAGDGVTADDLAAAVVSFSGYTTVVPNTAAGVVTGSGENDWIASFRTGNTCSVLLAPQTMTGKPFFKVTARGAPQIWEPMAADSVQLRAGYSYDYAVTVEKEGLVVTATGSSAWGSGSSSTVPGGRDTTPATGSTTWGAGSDDTVTGQTKP